MLFVKSGQCDSISGVKVIDNERVVYPTRCFTILHFLHSLADVSVVRIKPDPQQLPCPRQMIEFQCQILVPTATLIWSLHTGEMLEFGVLRSIGDVRSSSDNVYSATLTGKREDDDPSTDRFFFASTLLIREPLNQTTLTCTGVGGVDRVDNSTTITQSGKNNYVF
jgi:hypothetical protein